jgi:peptidoglycan/LPS O-acetylase OafA/YrhL
MLGPSDRRVKTLDAVRGLAALVVALDHAYLTVPEGIRTGIHSYAEPWFWLRYSPLRLMLQGSAAVMAFFVLSGFVLILPFLDGTQPRGFTYLTPVAGGGMRDGNRPASILLH